MNIRKFVWFSLKPNWVKINSFSGKMLFPTSNKLDFSCQCRRYSTTMKTKTNIEKFVMPQKRKYVGFRGYSLLVFPAITFCLGCWQVQRKKWKEGLLQMIDERIHSAPLALPEIIDPSSISALEYTPFSLTGTFLHDREMYILPRHLVTEKTVARKRFVRPPGQEMVPEQVIGLGRRGGGGGGIISDTVRNGVLVITPFKLTGRDDIVLVNRGWVPRKYADPSSRPLGQITDEVTVTGVARRAEKQPWALKFGGSGGGSSGGSSGGGGGSEGRTFSFRDINGMAEMGGALPVFLDVTLDSSLPHGPVGGQTRVKLRNTHLEYVITWYGLTFFSTLIWYKHYFR